MTDKIKTKTIVRKACAKCGKEYTDEKLQACPDDDTALAVIESELAPGATIGERYVVVGCIADGGMGKVYKAKHKLIDKYVALKTLLPNMTLSGAVLKRFQQEADALCKLTHPNILSVTDFFVSAEGHPFLVTDYLEGKSLQNVLDTEGKLPIERAKPIFLQVCAALKHAHHHSIIHRDLKPSNIMLIDTGDEKDVVKIIDFGIAKLLATETRISAGLTATGDVFGSPPYMSPEQCRGRKMDGRTDIYSLGCVFYAMIAGRPPFVCHEDVEYMVAHVHETPAPLPEDVPPDIVAVVTKMLAKEPDDRFQTPEAVIEALTNAPAPQSMIVPSISAAVEPAAAPAAASEETKTEAQLDPHKFFARAFVVPLLVVAVVGLCIVGFANSNRDKATPRPNSTAFPEAAAPIAQPPASAAPVAPAPSPAPAATHAPAPTHAAPAAAPARPRVAAPAPRYAAAPVAAPAAGDYKSLMADGQKNFKVCNYAKAMKDFSRAHNLSFGEDDPRFIDSLEWQGKTAAKMGNYSGAMQAFRYVIDVSKSRGNEKRAKIAEDELKSADEALHRMEH